MLSSNRTMAFSRIIYGGALALALFGAAACLEDPECQSTDLSCNPQNWLLYLAAASQQQALCSGGTAAATNFYGFYGANGNDSANAVCPTRDGGYIVAGNASADVATLGGQTPLIPYTGGTDPLIIKLSASGAVEWYSFAGTATTGEAFFSVIETGDGGYVAAGALANTLATLGGVGPVIPHQASADGIVARFDANGGIVWWTFLGSAGGSNDSIRQIFPASDGGFIVTGLMGDLAGLPVAPLNAHAGGLLDAMVAKLSSSGAVEWVRYFGSGMNEQGIDVTATSDGGYAVTGLVASAAFTNVGGQVPLLGYTGGSDPFVARLDANGGLLWHTYLGAAGNQDGRAITEFSDGGLGVLIEATGPVNTLGGQAALLAPNTNDMHVVRLNQAGAVEWHTPLPSAGAEAPGDIAVLTDGSLIVAGNASANIATLGGKTPLRAYSANSDMLIARLTSAGAVDWYTFVGAINDESALGLSAMQDGGYALVGEMNSNLNPLGSLTPSNAFINANEFFVLRGDATGIF